MLHPLSGFGLASHSCQVCNYVFVANYGHVNLTLSPKEKGRCKCHTKLFLSGNKWKNLSEKASYVNLVDMLIKWYLC